MRFHGVDGVADEVEKHLHELVAVAAHSGEHGFKLQFNARCGRAKIERTKLHGIGHHGVDIEKRALWGNLPCKAQQISNQRFCPPRLLADFRSRRTRLVGQSLVIRQEVRKPKNGGERIIDFMSCTGSKLSQ